MTIRVYFAGVFCAATLAVGATPLAAQTRAMARGRVLTDSTERAIAGATVSIPRLHLNVTSDSLGRFALLDVAPGDHLVIVRRLGFVRSGARSGSGTSSRVRRSSGATPPSSRTS